MSDFFPQPSIIAHRGASKYAPENTLSAFDLAIRQGADGIELDAKLCASGQVVIIHDATVDRTTNGSGKVAGLSLEELKSLDAGASFDKSFMGESIPTLEEVFDLVGGRIVINIELTNYTTPMDSLLEKVAQRVAAYNHPGKILFSSFNPLNLVNIHRLLPAAPVGLLSTKGTAGHLAQAFFSKLIHLDTFHPHYENVTQNLIDYAHRTQRQVITYTVNETEHMKDLLERGVDGIITDDPPLARQTLEALHRKQTGSSEIAGAGYL